jgi:prepilin peptidase CpaA
MDVLRIIWILTIALTFVAALMDWRTRRIPNWLTVSGVVAGTTLHAALAGWHGALFALEGAGLALALLLPPVLMRLIGAGDWKLMGAVGAFLGPVLVLFVFLLSIFASGLMAMTQMIITRRVSETFRNMFVLVRGFFSFGLKANPRVSLDTPHSLKLPFGIAVAAATLICYCATRWIA